MDKPCFWYEDQQSKCLREEDENCIRGTSWNSCDYGKGGKYGQKKRPSIDQAKLAKARKIREEVWRYLFICLDGLCESDQIAAKSQLTKIIKKHL